jgi:hypothetical protein
VSRRTLGLLLLAALLALAFVLGPRACGRGRGGAPRTILLLTIDTLRRDHVGAFAEQQGAARTITPRLDALSRAGVRFLDARTPVPLTLPAHVAMLSGRPPAETGVRLNAYGRLPPPAARGFPLLAERLQAEGWSTGAFVSAQPLEARLGLDQGFDRYDDGAEAYEEAAAGVVPERPGDTTCARALAWLERVPTDRPAFVWVHLFEPHAPYALRYADDVAAADAVVGRLLDGLHAAGRAEGLAVLLTSDHGEMLGDLGERTHGFLLGDHVLRVPFTLVAPDLQPGLRTDPVDLTDVAPTLAALARVDWEVGTGPFGGRNLLAGPGPAARVRVAESLYAHHSYRWAQLIAASDATGTLVDAGGERLGWLLPAPAGEPQGGWRPAIDPPEALGAAIARYRAAERRERVATGAVESPYGGAGAVVPFLSEADNGRLPDPYREIAQVTALHQLKGQLLAAVKGQVNPRALRESAEQLGALATRDPQNPEIAFLQGLERRAAAQLALGSDLEAQGRSMLTEAEQAFGRAFELGRQDARTLLQWVGVHAEGREEVALERLRQFMPLVGPDCQLDCLEAQLCTRLGRTEDAAAACRRAEATCRTPKERGYVTKACR